MESIDDDLRSGRPATATTQENIDCVHHMTAKVVSSEGKVMASIFWDAKGIVFIDYLRKGQTISGEYYANSCKRQSSQSSLEN
ncbi:histone-lysine N-methyltransferase SETMAR-like protein [Lates japonicus]|uniref:Histone-lysine N-methyltransferase SETMAR-like protein n=1 Tax=Lates japonicus TaxID=270547 RepID=A0AAD3RFP4_LATJO|nr:histone-lysine N-methyltransferase SETMAR-like protein [Lates japonicus]